MPFGSRQFQQRSWLPTGSSASKSLLSAGCDPT